MSFCCARAAPSAATARLVVESKRPTREGSHPESPKRLGPPRRPELGSGSDAQRNPGHREIKRLSYTNITASSLAAQLRNSAGNLRTDPPRDGYRKSLPDTNEPLVFWVVRRISPGDPRRA